VLDNLPAYFDVSTTPEDLLPWLARWLGIELDGGQSPDRQRELLEHASRLHGIQGTARGIELAVEAVFGVEATVQETGASAWSLDPTAPLPGQPQQAFVVTVRTGEGQVLDDRRVDALVAAMKPAHVVHRVTVQS
jgi:P2-related tail formation protein